MFKSVKPLLVIIQMRADDRAAMLHTMLISSLFCQDLAKLNMDFFSCMG